MTRRLTTSRRTLLKQLAFCATSTATLCGNVHLLASSGSKSARMLLRGGTVVNATGRTQADVLIADGRIVEIGPRLVSGRARTRVIDAGGLQILPGGIDPHVHLTPPFVDDFASGSRAALAGGVTTVGAMAFADEGESLPAMLARHGKAVASQAIADVMLHPFLGAPTRLQDLPAIAAAGHTSFKIFTIDGNFDQEFPQYVAVFEKAVELGLLPMIHCEDAAVLRHAQQRLTARRHTSLEHYEPSRPVLSEVLAVEKAVALCELTGAPIYIVHLSSARALEACRAAQARGLRVYVETRPIYLHLTSEKYRTADGPLFVAMPPIRSAADGAALWQGLAGGAIHTLGSDHAPWLRQQKFDPRHDISDPLAGMSNLQVMLPMLYSEGVLQGRLTLERFVAVTATQAAKLFGLYPRKGVVQVGADADVTLWDPTATWTVRAVDGFSREDFSVYEGWTLTGRPRLTLRRGEVAFEDGRVTAEPGSGALLRRSRWSAS